MHLTKTPIVSLSLSIIPKNLTFNSFQVLLKWQLSHLFSHVIMQIIMLNLSGVSFSNIPFCHISSSNPQLIKSACFFTIPIFSAHMSFIALSTTTLNLSNSVPWINFHLIWSHVKFLSCDNKLIQCLPRIRLIIMIFRWLGLSFHFNHLTTWQFLIGNFGHFFVDFFFLLM